VSEGRSLQALVPPPAPEPLAGLYRAVAGATGVVICTHRNPDPDSISSALALRYFLENAAGVRSIVAYEGVIGRAENRAMVSLLRLHLRPLSSLAHIDWSQVALVDTQPRSGNNSFPRTARPLLVIDHHPALKTTQAACGSL
jgi:nanoRNase/pAp phosphatase (c-di-AMP/oligoRNAs hydrolase)